MALVLRCLRRMGCSVWPCRALKSLLIGDSAEWHFSKTRAPQPKRIPNALLPMQMNGDR